MKDLNTYTQSETKFEFLNYISSPIEYDMSSTKGCIVFPLFCAEIGKLPYKHIISAFWAMNALLVNSNIKEQKVPIYFYVEKVLFYAIRHLFENAGVTPDMLLLYEPLQYPDKSDWKGRWLSQKLYACLDERFDEYEKVVMFDVDLFLARRDTDSLFDINRLWKRQDRTKFAICYIRKDNDKVPMLYHGDSKFDNEIEHELFRNRVYELFKKDIVKTYDSDGYIYSFCPNELNVHYKSFVAKYTHLFYNDEHINSLYMQCAYGELEDLDDVWDIILINNEDEFLNLDANHFLTHIPKYKMTDSEVIDQWKKEIGIWNNIK